MSPREDSEHFSVNCSFLCHPSRLLALGWPLRRFQAPLRPGRPSAPPPRANAARKSPLPTLGKRSAWGQSGGGGRNRNGEKWREVSTNPTRARATGQLGCRPDTPTLSFAAPLAGALSQLKRRRKTGLRGPFPFLPPHLPCSGSPSRKQPPLSLPQNFLGSFSQHRPEVGFNPVLG